MDEESLLLVQTPQKPSAMECPNHHYSPSQKRQQQPPPQHDATDTALNVRFRTIQPKDRTQIQALHEEWFPVEYQQEFYDELCWHQRMCHSGHKLYTMVATVPRETHAATNNNDDGCGEVKNDGDDRSSQEEEAASDERIVACLVGCVLSAHKLNRTSRQMLVPEFPRRHSKLFYVMTLGTVTEYRHLGLATRLVRQVVDDVVRRDAEMGTVYLHVITLNDAAIRFYEDRLGFWKVQEIADYYTIDGDPYNCYLYAKYFHGACDVRVSEWSREWTHPRLVVVCFLIMLRIVVSSKHAQATADTWMFSKSFRGGSLLSGLLCRTWSKIGRTTTGERWPPSTGRLRCRIFCFFVLFGCRHFALSRYENTRFLLIPATKGIRDSTFKAIIEMKF